MRIFARTPLSKNIRRVRLKKNKKETMYTFAVSFGLHYTT